MRRECGDRGTVTAELAACLPVLLVVVGVAVGAVTVADARVRADDAAREAVRAAARGDETVAQRLVHAVAPGASVRIDSDGDVMIARVDLVVRPLASWLPAVTVSEQASALDERSR